MIMQENVSAKDFSTFRIGGTIRYYATIESIGDLQKAYSFAEEKKIPLIVIGEGSNTIWQDGEHTMLAVSLAFKNVSVLSENDETIIWQIGAGVIWDALVEKSVAENVWGIECMSGIPGSVGAAPVQNIGAYGQELKDVFISCEVYDIDAKKIKNLSHADCHFSYRNSIFKSTEKGKYVIFSVTIQLSKKASVSVGYESLQKYFDDMQIVNPNISDIRNAVLFIRSTKLPDPSIVPNCGSFFENPIIENTIAEKLKEKFPDIKIFPTEKNNLVKIPAGWLIEKAGLKGKNFGTIEVYKNNALVLINIGNANFAELMEAKNNIVGVVKEMFGIELEMEPNIMQN